MNWLGKLWREIFRKEVRQEPLPTSPSDTYDAENRLLAYIGQDFWNVVRGQSKATVRQIVTTAKKEGLPSAYLQYLFWVLVKQRKTWPSLPQTQYLSLIQAIEVVQVEGDMPNYRQGLQVIPPQYEKTVQEIIRALAAWASTGLLVAIMGGYWEIFRARKQEAEVLFASRGVPSNKTVGVLRAFFEDTLQQAPLGFPHGGKLLSLLFQFPG